MFKTLTFSPDSSGPLHEEVMFDKKNALALNDRLELKNSLREVLFLFLAIVFILKENPKNIKIGLNRT